MGVLHESVEKPQVLLRRQRLSQWLPQLQRNYQQPIMVMDKTVLQQQVARFKAALPSLEIHFAVKSNPDEKVVAYLLDTGIGVEIASQTELDLVLQLGVSAQEVFYSNPVKSPRYIAYAASKGVQWFVVDSVNEMEKIISIAPNAKLYLRIHTSNQGASVALSTKFGANKDDAQTIIKRAVEVSADLAGVTFHVGSQCLREENWREGIEQATTLFGDMKAAGLRPRLLDIGGGYPVSLDCRVPSIETIATVINDALEPLLRDFPETRLLAEPGRYLVAQAGEFICQIVAANQRLDQRWLYLDAGFYGGLLEIKEDLQYPITTLSDGELQPWVLAGPTCDSIDICREQSYLPDNVTAGDWVMISYAGAYSNACACEFNGFPLPKVILQ